MNKLFINDLQTVFRHFRVLLSFGKTGIPHIKDHHLCLLLVHLLVSRLLLMTLLLFRPVPLSHTVVILTNPFRRNFCTVDNFWTDYVSSFSTFLGPPFVGSVSFYRSYFSVQPLLSFQSPPILIHSNFIVLYYYLPTFSRVGVSRNIGYQI